MQGGRHRGRRLALAPSLALFAAGLPLGAAAHGQHGPLGGLGGAILGAIFQDQIAQHEAWHRAYDPPHPGHCCDEGYDCGCDGQHTWPDDGDAGGAWSEGDPAHEGGYESSPHPVLDLGVPEVLFDPGSASLTRGAEARLRYVAQQVRERDDVEVLLRGHSDQREQDGFDLSEARARAVRAFLAEEGVPVRRIAWVGFGDAQPVASNETAAGRQRNRRVEVVLREPEPYS